MPSLGTVESCSRSMPRRRTCATRCAAVTASVRPPRTRTSTSPANTAPDSPYGVFLSSLRPKPKGAPLMQDGNGASRCWSLPAPSRRRRGRHRPRRSRSRKEEGHRRRQAPAGAPEAQRTKSARRGKPAPTAAHSGEAGSNRKPAARQRRGQAQRRRRQRTEAKPKKPPAKPTPYRRCRRHQQSAQAAMTSAAGGPRNARAHSMPKPTSAESSRGQATGLPSSTLRAEVAASRAEAHAQEVRAERRSSVLTPTSDRDSVTSAGEVPRCFDTRH